MIAPQADLTRIYMQLVLIFTGLEVVVCSG